MLTTVLNDSPIFPENEEEQADLSAPLLMDSPQVSVIIHLLTIVTTMVLYTVIVIA